MANPNRAALLLAAALALPPGPARAGGGVILKHTVTVYGDDQGHPMKRPEGVACSEAGTIVVADTGNHRLLSYTLKGTVVMGGREIKVGALQWPLSVQLDPKGEILVLDGKTRSIVRLDAQGTALGAVEWKGLPGEAAVVPASFKVDRSGGLVVLDGAGKAVLVADAAGTVGRRLPLPAGKGPFTDVCVDPGGTVYALDPVGGAIWAADKAATELHLVTGALKELASFPSALATDGQGSLFVVDRNGGSIVQLGTDGSYRARHGRLGWADGELYYPTEICVGSDALVVADRSNQRVQVFSVLR